jgi:hypothetical protein
VKCQLPRSPQRPSQAPMMLLCGYVSVLALDVGERFAQHVFARTALSERCRANQPQHDRAPYLRPPSSCRKTQANRVHLCQFPKRDPCAFFSNSAPRLPFNDLDLGNSRSICWRVQWVFTPFSVLKVIYKMWYCQLQNRLSEHQESISIAKHPQLNSVQKPNSSSQWHPFSQWLEVQAHKAAQ